MKKKSKLIKPGKRHIEDKIQIKVKVIIILKIRPYWIITISICVALFKGTA